MAKHYWFFRLLLKLYPKEFQNQYAEPIVQTLTDMLADQPTRSGRILIWLHTSFDVMLQIIQQNIIQLGESIVHTTIFKSRRFIGALVVLFFGMIIIFHHTIQANVIPFAIKPFYGNNLERTLTAQNLAVQNPLQEIFGSQPKAVNVCVSELLQGIHTQIACQSTFLTSSKIDQSSGGKQAMSTKLQSIEAALAKNGYTSGSNGVTLSSLVLGTYQGKDYSPDAYYVKKVGMVSCVFDSYIAYSNPSPPVISTNFNCSRNINVFGAPHIPAYPTQQR